MSERKKTSAAWPKIRVEWSDPDRKPLILGMAAARRRWPKTLDDGVVAAMLAGTTAGVGPAHGGTRAEDVRTLWRYTREDAVRDAAPALLAALECIASGKFDDGEEAQLIASQAIAEMRP